jgi:hypothetical protein
MVESIERHNKVQLQKARKHMLEYIMNMVEYICSGDEEEDRRNMELLAQSILERSLELHK